jgi:hypothetical protein
MAFHRRPNRYSFSRTRGVNELSEVRTTAARRNAVGIHLVRMARAELHETIEYLPEEAA